MTAPSASLPRTHLHAIPHGDTLPDGSLVADGWPFLLEVSGVRTLWQNQNGDWTLLGTVPAGGTTGQLLAKVDGTDGNVNWVDAPSGGGGGGDDASPDGTQWVNMTSNFGKLFPVPVPGTGPYIFVDKFESASVPLNVGTPWNDVGTTSTYYDASADGRFIIRAAIDGGDTCIVVDPGDASDDHHIGCEIVAMPSSGNFIGIYARSIGRTNEGYGVLVDDAGVLTIEVREGGTSTTLDTATGTVVVGAKLYLDVVADAITGTAINPDNSVVQATATDSTVGSGHNIVARLHGGQIAVLFTSSVALHA